MSGLGSTTHPQLLVGTETSDDAGVYLLNDGLALVNTVDFITPAVDDPFVFGQIAAANSLSDIYAMGGVPLTAMNLVMFPAKKLSLSVLKEILKGGAEKVGEAGAVVIGGHSVEDEEPKYGLSVTGKVHPQEIWRNSGAQAGDALILTKPLGSGVLLNAVRGNKFSYKNLLEQVIPSLIKLNSHAAQAARGLQVHAATDVTGFGILGHGLEMAKGAGLTLELNHARLPFYDGALKMYQKGITTRSNQDNRKLMKGFLELAQKLDSAEEERLFDPQTSGGLLLSVPETSEPMLLKALAQAGVEDAVCIGHFREGTPKVRVV